MSASLLADALFGDAVLVAALAACAIFMGARRLYRWISKGGEPPSLRALSSDAVRGLGLGAIFLLSAMVCWFVGEAASGGRLPDVQLWAGRIVLAQVLGLIACRLLTPMTSRQWETGRGIVFAVVLASLAVALVLYLVLTGPANVVGYPAAEFSSYRLPWPSGVTRLCIQSNRGIVSHRGTEGYAYDFAMPVGSFFCAARAGTVVSAWDEEDGNGFGAPNNQISVWHEDGTVAVYAHLRQGGSLVQPGQRVARGERLGLSGNVGQSMLPHLHFHVASGSHTIPVSFADVPGDGVPRMFRRYTSGESARLSTRGPTPAPAIGPPAPPSRRPASWIDSPATCAAPEGARPPSGPVRPHDSDRGRD